MRGTALIATMLLLVGCAGDPDVGGDHASPKFRTDLKACRASSRAQVAKQDARYFLGWLASPVTAPGQVHRTVRACMEGKGYPAPSPS